MGGKILLLIVLTLVLLVPLAVATREVLYFWGGFGWLQKDPFWADAISVVDFDRTSPTYGQVLKIAPVNSIAIALSLIPLSLQIRLPSGNEPHHSSISPDGRYLATGGLLSFLQKSDEIFVWDLQDPMNPSLIFSCDPVGACTDEFVWYTPTTGPSGWLVSQMCSGLLSPNIIASDSPGAYVFVNPVARTCTEWSVGSTISPSNSFDPHGFDIKPGVGLISTDYIWPFSLASPINPITMRNTLRLFGFDGKQKKCWTVTTTNNFTADAGGFMDAHFIPGDPLNRAITCSTMGNFMYLVDPVTGPKEVFDLEAILHIGRTRSAGILRITADGNRLIMTHAMRCLVLFDISDRDHPRLLKSFDFCDPLNGLNINCAQFDEGKPGAHYVLLVNDQRIVVITYFLSFLKFQYYGTRQAFVFDLNADKTDFTLDHSFDPDFSETGDIHVKTSVNVPLVGLIGTDVAITITQRASPHSVQYRSLAPS